LTMTWCKALYLRHVHIFHYSLQMHQLSSPLDFFNLILTTGCSEPTDRRETVRATIGFGSRLRGFVIPFVLD
jgi:hypothetical protein